MTKMMLTTLLLLATTVHAQERISVVSIVTSVAVDPTTYAPALIYRAALKADWDSSQPLFARGYVEKNKMFSRAGLPISYEEGNGKIDKLALRFLADSLMHNAASHGFEALLKRNYPDHKKLLTILGWAERIAVNGYLARKMATQHYEQAARNRQMLEGR